MDSYLDSNTNKAIALQAELKGSEVKPNGDFLDITYKEKTLSINATTGAIKQPLPVITAGQKAPATSNAQYKSGNYTAVIPAGFKVSNQPGESSIETGLVIKDDAGNEFVWIPVGIPRKSDSSKTIELSRYTFGSNGTPTNQDSNSYFEEEPRETGTNNAVAKNINEFISKTNVAGGFWIGRYEARTTSSTARSSSSDPLTAVTEKPEYSVYNYIKQTDASAKAIAMYDENDYFQSDLINSYAWDTATLFLQEYDNRTGSNFTKYSWQNSINKGSLLATGTVSETNKDKICNVYDMASNCYEWTTETSSNSPYPCVKRGGYCNDSDYYTSLRISSSTTNAYGYNSFRPVLYVK